MHFDERVVTGEKPKGKQGFASMAPERVKEIASMGGRRAAKLGINHRWTSAEAREAGRKGGKNRWKNATKPAA